MSELEYVEMSLRQLRLRSGVALQTRRVAPNLPNAPKDEAHFLAAIDGKGVMVSHEGRTALDVGSDYRVSGFTGQYDFHFSAPVLQTFQAPFAYSLLASPKVVKARLIRKAARMRVTLPATVVLAGVPNPVTILDLSVCGAMFDTSTAVGSAGDVCEIVIEFPFEAEMARLSLSAGIRHSYRSVTGGFHVGVSFRDVTTENKLLLHYLSHSATEQND